MGIFNLFGQGRKRNESETDNPRQENAAGDVGCRQNPGRERPAGDVGSAPDDRIYRERHFYERLCKEVVVDKDARKIDLGEGMWVFEKVLSGRYRQLYLADDRSRTAVRFMDEDGTLQTVGLDDIDWDSLKGIPESIVERARRLFAWFPTWFGQFKDGVAKIHWEINPEGRYYMDDDGYGMEPEDETILFSYVDRRAKPLIKFRYIKDFKELKAMEEEARANLNAGRQ